MHLKILLLLDKIEAAWDLPLESSSGIFSQDIASGGARGMSLESLRIVIRGLRPAIMSRRHETVPPPPEIWPKHVSDKR
jgi:hypothetical protein